MSPQTQTARSRARAIPSHASPLVGRRFVLEQLDNALRDNALLVLWGPPGIGKSRLAHALSEQWFDRHGDGDAWVVDLAAARDEAEALSALAATIGLPAGTAPAQTRAHLQRLLRRKRPALVVLDHCEHLKAVAETWADDWAVTGPNRLVATSRTRLDGWAELAVPSLTDDEALRLVEQRARRVRDSFRLDPATRADLIQLIHEVDGLPAALELLGPRLMLLTPTKLLDRLRSGPARLEQALEQSWELLEDAERETLLWLAATRGGFDVELACAMLPDDPIDLLESLVQHAWLHAAEGPDGVRLRLLHEAQRFLKSRGIPEAATAAQARAITELAEVWDAGIESNDEAACTRRLVENLPNLFAAWEGAPDDRLRVRVGLVLHFALQRGGDHGRQDELTQQTLASAEAVGEPILLSRARLARARVLRWNGDLAGSLATLEASLDGADPATRCGALRNLGAGTWATGDMAKTREWADLALAAALEVGTTEDEVNARNGLGFLLSATGDLEGAREHLERALELSQGGEHPIGLIALVSSSLAGLDAREERWLEAERHSSRAIEIYNQLGYKRQAPLELLYRAEARVASGRVRAAMEDVDAAESIADRWAFDTLAIRALYLRGVVNIAAGDAAAALDALDVATARLADRDDAQLLYEVRRAAAVAHLVRGNEEPAAALADDEPLSVWLRQLASGEAVESPKFGPPLHCVLAHSLEVRTRELVVSDAGRGFRLDGGEEVNLTRRKALRGILHALAERHRDEPLTLDEVMEAGWPGEVMTAESGSQRVYVTIKRLRDLGLEPVLLTAGDGYMLDPAVELVRS